MHANVPSCVLMNNKSDLFKRPLENLLELEFLPTPLTSPPPAKIDEMLQAGTGSVFRGSERAVRRRRRMGGGRQYIARHREGKRESERKRERSVAVPGIQWRRRSRRTVFSWEAAVVEAGGDISESVSEGGGPCGGESLYSRRTAVKLRGRRYLRQCANNFSDFHKASWSLVNI